MKKIIFVVIIAILSLNVNAQAVYIPDLNFRNYCLSNPSINTNQDNEISVNEAYNFDGFMDVSYRNISSLEGIEYFENITMLDCSYNDLTILDLTENTALEWLNCENNMITDLFLSSDCDIWYLNCSDNPLTNGVFDSDIPSTLKILYINNTEVEHIWAGGNSNLEEIYFFNCPELKSLEVNDCVNLRIVNGTEAQISYIINFSNLEFLEDVLISGTSTEEIIFKNNINLQRVLLFDNTEMESIVFENCPILSIINISDFFALESVDVSQCPQLEELEITGCGLNSIDVSNNLMLKKLDVSTNNISGTLDVSQNELLEELYCIDNKISNLNLNTDLKKLICFENPFLESLNVTACDSLEILNAHMCHISGTLDLRNNYNLTSVTVSMNNIFNLLLNDHPNLTYLDCDSNHISSLNLKDCPSLTELYCKNNDLQQLNVSKCFDLVKLDCSYNDLQQLNVSNLSNLEVLNCRHNNLNYLRIDNGNEHYITSFNAKNNPNLFCIEVGILYVAWATIFWSAYKDSIAIFSDTCYYNPSIVEISLNKDTTTIFQNDTIFIGEAFNGDSITGVRFDIENLGNSILYLTGNPPVNLTGNNVSDFSCNYLETDVNIEPSEYTSFFVKFNPDSSGNKFVQILIPNNDTDENPFVFTIIGKGVQHLVNDTALTIGADANSTVSFNINSDRNWTLTSNKPWLTPSQTSGNGNALITLTAQENPTNIPRSAIITISASPTLTQTITVTQQGAVVSLNISDTILFMNALNGSTNTFNISVNRSWTISSNQPWLNVSPSSGNAGNHLITVMASENTASVSRTALVSVACLNVTKNLLVIQNEGIGISNEDYALYGQRIDGTNADDNLGNSVSINGQGNIIAVGIPLNDDNGSNSGKIKVFQLSPSKSVNWMQIGQDIKGVNGSRAGWSVSLNGDGSIIAIGSPYENYNEGRVRVYQYQNNQWVQLGQTIVGKTQYTGFTGYSVDLNESGTMIAVGEYLGQNQQGNSTGLVCVYELQNNTWVQKGTTIYGNQTNSYFGWSVSMNSDGTKVIVGAKSENNSKGASRVYKFENNQWVQLGQTIIGQANLDYSGTSVSINYDGNIIAIGAPQNDGNGSNSGVTKIYRLENNNWVQMGSDINGEASDDYAGYSVSLNYWGSVVAIGAYRNSQNHSRAGQVRVYQFKNNTWTQIGQDIDGEAYYDYFGNSVSINNDGTRFIAGAYQADFGGSNSGSAYVFKKNVTHFMNVTPDTLNFTVCNNLTSSITVSSNVSWNVSSNKPWVSLSQTSGTGNSNIIVTLSSNQTDTTRTAELTFTAGNLVKTIIINQVGLPKMNVYHTTCDSYSFNGHTYTQSGIYTDTISNTNFCDTIIILHLNIKKSSSSENNVIACDSYTWLGTTYSQSGTYTKIIPNAVGCDSIITTNLTIINSPNAGINAFDTVCNSETSVNLFSLLGGTPNQGGTWSDDNNSGAMQNGIFNPTQVTVPATYNFTYIVSGNGVCNNDSATVSIYVDVCSGLTKSDVVDVNIYPNPPKEILYIDFGTVVQNTEITLMNAAGQIIRQTLIHDESKHTINLTEYPEGFYILRIIMNDKVFVKRIVLK